jgi:hypothetical protein
MTAGMRRRTRTSAASEPCKRSGARGPRERACRGDRRGEPPRILQIAAVILLGGSSSVFACPMCFGAEETSMIDATKLGVFVMLAIVIAVQCAFVGFFFYLRQRAKRIAEIELDTEWSQLQGVSRTS